MKFLFDLFPVALFFVAFKVWGIFVATAVTIVATLAQIAWVAFRHRKVEPALWVSLGVIVVLGGSTLLLRDEMFIKWKPTVLYWVFALTLLISRFGFDKNLMQAMLGKKIVLPQRAWSALNSAWAGFFVVLGCLNLAIAYQFSTDTWVNFKLFGGTALMFIFIIIQSIWLTRYLKSE